MRALAGKVINRAGLPAMLSDPEGFPWPAQTVAQVLADPALSLTLANGSAVGPEHLAGKNVALYFSAAWCAPCKGAELPAAPHARAGES